MSLNNCDKASDLKNSFARLKEAWLGLAWNGMEGSQRRHCGRILGVPPKYKLQACLWRWHRLCAGTALFVLLPDLHSLPARLNYCARGMHFYNFTLLQDMWILRPCNCPVRINQNDFLAKATSDVNTYTRIHIGVLAGVRALRCKTHRVHATSARACGRYGGLNGGLPGGLRGEAAAVKLIRR
eukprot:357218-Chlamydomonas_euryale.AAC.5